MRHPTISPASCSAAPQRLPPATAAIPPWMKIAASIGRATRRRSMRDGSRTVVVANPTAGHHARVTTQAPTTGNAQLAIGIDIGGTKIAGGLVDRTGTVHAELEEPTPPRSGAVVIATILLDLVARLREGHEVVGIGVGAILAMNLMAPGVMREMATSLAGIATLVLTGTLWAVAFVLIRRTTRVDV